MMIKIKPLVWETEPRSTIDRDLIHVEFASFPFGKAFVWQRTEAIRWELEGMIEDERIMQGECSTIEEGKAIAEEKYQWCILSCLEYF